MITTKRVYESVSATDGYRVLIDRLWPRGVKKVDLPYNEWNKSVAPSTELRKWFHQHSDQFEQFSQRYMAELQHCPAAWWPLVEKAQHGYLTLLYAAKDIRHNHAKVLKLFLEEQIKQQTVQKIE
ncbi:MULTISPECIES: DUF488 domain-containing protein [Enterobacterales]|uniref:YeaO family protein n=1 Tax=Moellerella wisconsensis ATCC 35017 TaxID=1354267 RepID=A0A0N1KJG5_9GAMM|nr:MULTISPECIES: DUF488 family protein [Enterobacterales]KPD03804.1 YeaO family protein [Moellerella wisconsensis ATCC 35017]VFS50152.1 Uncharacterized conserved protein [Moellerella wisconsensis]